MNDSILRENEKNRLNIRLPLLICFAMFAAWQMGMVYFSGQTMSVDGKTPLPVNIEDVTAIIVAGYLLSVLVMIFVPRIIVWAERITCALALLSALGLFLPLSPDSLAFILYVQYACCCFMIGFETAVIVGLFTEKTAIMHLTVAYGIAMLIVAILHNDFIEFTFPYFRLFAIVAIAMQLLFHCKLPGNVWTRYAKKEDNLVMPKRFFASIFLWVLLSCFVILFGVAVSETITHGVFIYYLTSALGGGVVFILWKKLGISPLSVCPFIAAFGALGFVLAISSLYVPSLAIVACSFLGIASMACWVNPLVAGVLLIKRYPSRFISPAIIFTAFIAVIIHTLLLDAFRTNASYMYAAYLILSVFMVILFLLLKPFLDYASKGEHLISEERSLELINEARAATVSGASISVDITDNKMHPNDKLTERECQIAQELMSGLNYKEIAGKLFISPHTVMAHRKTIYSKMGVHNVAGLINKIKK